MSPWPRDLPQFGTGDLALPQGTRQEAGDVTGTRCVSQCCEATCVLPGTILGGIKEVADVLGGELLTRLVITPEVMRLLGLQKAEICQRDLETLN